MFAKWRMGNLTVKWRQSDARCRAARCATGAVRNLALRFTTFENELLVATPHKAGSRYVVESLAKLYNCTLARRWYGEARRCGESDAARLSSGTTRASTSVALR